MDGNSTDTNETGAMLAEKAGTARGGAIVGTRGDEVLAELSSARDALNLAARLCTFGYGLPDLDQLWVR